MFGSLFTLSMASVSIHKRKFKRKFVTETYNKLSEFYSYNHEQKTLLIAKLQSHLSELKELDKDIQSLIFTAESDEKDFDSEFTKCDEYISKIQECLVSLNSNVAHPDPIPNRPNSLQSHLRSPVAPLPSFSSKEGEDLSKFFIEFEQTISRFNYPDYDKLLLLKQQVSGRALFLINSLDIKNQGYNEAKTLLEKALGTKDIQIYNLIKQLSEIKLDNDDDPFVYMSKMCSLRDGFKTLKITSDMILQYFFWNGLNESFKLHLINITNETRPSLKNILDKFFVASERYLCQTKVTKPSKGKNTTAEAASLAVAVNYDKGKSKVGICKLCVKTKNDPNHNINKCPNFIDASSKRERLINIKGCIRCGNVNHLADSCNFRFNSRCFNCRAWHMTFLCTKPKTYDQNSNAEKSNEKSAEVKGAKDDVKSSDQKKPITKTTSASMVQLTDVLSVDTNDSVILPTFDIKINQSLLRGIKDSACQANLISERVANDLNLKVINNNVSLMVKGINVHKTVQTRQVECNLNIGEKCFKVKAYCYPHLNINLDLPYLSDVVLKFKDKGFKLADSHLGKKDCIDNVDFILGAQSAYCLPETEYLFGHNKQSIYSVTHAGVLLKGNIDIMFNDLNFLTFNDVSFHCLKTTFSPSKTAHVKSNLDENDESLGVHESTVQCESFQVMDEQGIPIYSELTKATDEILNNTYKYIVREDPKQYSDEVVELNQSLCKYALDNTLRDANGRLIMPLLWNHQVSHLLSKNFYLAKSILGSLLKKYESSDKLNLIDETFKTQESLGIIERIDNVEGFIKSHPECSFLPFMGIFKPNNETTKTRVVFLSNLSEKCNNSTNLSHNQTIFSGPCLNQKLSSALLHLRFGAKLLCFDLVKAFLQIKLNEIDQNRLLFLWVRNINQGDHSIIAYKNLRLSFGLRCSPAILMLGLFKILILDVDDDNRDMIELKRLLYQLTYMDNCAIVGDDSDYLDWAFNKLNDIFKPYCFELQKFCTNDVQLKSKINDETKTSNLLGLQWNTEGDFLLTKPINLNINSTTKREVLSTIAAHFDLFNFNLPLLNRSRLYLHELQSDKNLSWDEVLSSERIKTWKKIAKQANSAPTLEIKRCVGSRSDVYDLIAYSDSSQVIFGCVIYLYNICTKELSFVLSKNRIVNKQLQTKSIPALELQAITLASECVIDVFKELTDDNCVAPISIQSLFVYSDSMVAITWINSYSNKLEKMTKRNAFVLNRLEYITRLCDKHSITYKFVVSSENPADFTTRPTSYKVLAKSNYLTGPNLVTDSNASTSRDDTLVVTVPNPRLELTKNCNVGAVEVESSISQLVDPTRVSGFSKLIAVNVIILKFVNILKERLVIKNPAKYGHLKVNQSNFNFYDEALHRILMIDQREHFPEIFQYFDSETKKLSEIPSLVNQLNIYMDQSGLLRVQNKLARIKNTSKYKDYVFPILISKQSVLVPKIINETHCKISHAGSYSVLAEIRRKFWIPKLYSIVKKTLKTCIKCKRFNSRPIKLNQNSYREIRLDPANIPFRNMYIDYMGPFSVKVGNSKTKVWVLVLTCMWSRAINLQICDSLDTEEFLRSFQLHCFRFGVPEKCFSDLGTQIVAGGNIISNFFNDHKSKEYFFQHGMQTLSFEQYYKGCSELGSLVEVCVKLTKKLIFSAIGRNVLSAKEFDYVIQQTIHLINRRPVAFKDALRDTENLNDIPELITPEKLIHGYELFSINTIPALQQTDDEWVPVDINDHIRGTYTKLQKVRSNLIRKYNEEFLTNLIHQATNVKNRYKPVPHNSMKVGDLVLLREDFCKPVNYPMGIIKDVIINDINEVTGATVMKGNRELVKRHCSTLIPYLSKCDNTDSVSDSSNCDISDQVDQNKKNRVKRKAAVLSELKTKRLLNVDIV